MRPRMILLPLLRARNRVSPGWCGRMLMCTLAGHLPIVIARLT